ncbi:bifunctional adenosylcobinamide kinase/adenosylcobinamide-phosphate guanylyltransferase [Methylophaga nitratireducenticrescens]|uniref:Bifunctional adenosylcobalamin biosynthesis protein n=1 Tax=Methylophaga nitratireducenticrescens TaxID=754476 RepID=I1XKY0_METNJ|nr:bifunctional adenosylcobinamide kinase/adenosylcobinamide-phosphate guanylyltransferase [Methylophaga nitratireducenticrescens]AFI85049.1 bifunctional adenosylcobinamide kinase/adenosylcobinamide-phosphate guanylyltransferase [Methylophaga nitratireducenticrescens]AUZ85054.1 bifunctional adenosylcobinamide kinase/adenosylcobinamide-phosphate guanylyltransferase [Methylophaga nitratireducenticrescens]
MAKTLILGGVKSGKSRLAEQRAINSKLDVCYVATARADDSEMQQRIALHQQQRPAHWTTVEVPFNLAATLQQQDDADKCILVDCLTLWLTNLLLADDEKLLTIEIKQLLKILPTLEAEIILVSNETSMGIVPMGELTRRFCDEAGRLHQQLAALMDNVILTVAGLPHTLKGN